MASTTIVVPDFQFSGTYYADILRRLRIFNRINAPEITSEVAEEPFIQLERAFALVGHLNNVLLDLVANEVLIPTAKLQDSVRQLLKLIDYQLADYAPATAELLIELNQSLSTSQEVLENNSLFETERDEDADPIPFEVDSTTIGPSNVVDVAWLLTRDRIGTDGVTVASDTDAFDSATAAWTVADVGKIIRITGSVLGNNGVRVIAEVLSTTRVRLGGTLGGGTPNFIAESGLNWEVSAYGANVATNLNSTGPTVSLWASPSVGDKFYFGSSYVLFDQFDLTFDTPGAGIEGVWEYYDPDESDETPDAVSDQTTFLRVTINSLLGTDDRSGALVRVTYLPTGTSELLESTFTGGVNVVDTSALLGQSPPSPSTDPDDYAIATDWIPFEDQVDGTVDLTGDGTVEYTFPQTSRRNWSKLSIQSVEAWYARYRVISVPGPVTQPILDEIDLDSGTQYLLVDATQGQTVENEPLASSNGLENQEFVLGQSPALRDSVLVYVDEGGGEIEWTNLTKDNLTLLTSASKDRHFEVSQNSLGVITVRFGDGTRGRIPALGVENLRFEYRVNANVEGDVGSDTVVVNSGGSSFVKSVTNPRPGFGWKEAEGASDESLALVKLQGPASLRTLNRATAPADYVDLAINFTASDGTKPIIRALAIEEGFGPKTIKLVVVGKDGVSIPASLRDELEDYFNGDDALGTEGVGAANTEVSVVNFTPRILNYTVTVEANSAVSQDLVKARLVALISPTAQDSNGNYFWSFGGRVPNSRVASEIFQISTSNIFDVDIATPSADVELGDEELPLINSSTLTITIVEP